MTLRSSFALAALRGGLVATVALTVLAGTMSLAGAQAPKVVARIDGVDITETDLAIALEDNERALQRVPEANRKSVVLQRIIELRLLSAQAAKDGLDKSPEFKAKLTAATQQLLTAEFLKRKVEGAITDADLKARYDKEIAGFDPPEEVKASHILVKTEEEAKAIMDELAKGGDFAKIAGEKSNDPGSKAQGGDLGFFSKGQMVPEFEQEAFTLKPGEISKAPIKTQFGFHILKVVEKRKQPVPGFDEVKDQVRELVVGEKFRAALDTLRTAAKVEILDKSLEAKPQP